MKIYVAGSTKQTERVKYIQGVVEGLRHSITFDWTKRVEQLGDAHTEHVRPEAQREGAYLDRDGVANADAMIVWLTPECLGALIEIGIACAVQVPTLLLMPAYPDLRHSIFYYMDHITEAHIKGGARIDVPVHEFLKRLESK